MTEYPTFRPLPGQVRWPSVPKWTDDHWRWWVLQAGMTPAQAETYLIERKVWGMSTTAKGQTAWLYQPTPKQLVAHQSRLPNVLYGGAAGGAKSHYLRWDFYTRCLQVPGYQALILRRTFPELERTHMRRALREVGLFGAKLVDTEVRFPKDALLEFGHAADEKAIQRYLSAEYDAIGFDEAGTFPKDFVLEISARTRSTEEGVQGVVRLTSNPQGAHTQYLVDRYIAHEVNVEEDPEYQPSAYGYISAKLFDNPYLMDADGTFTTYIRRLSALPPLRRKQLLDGDWDAIQGAFFSEFSRATHIRVLDLAPGLTWERWVDWGFNTPGVCHWVACLPDKRLYVRAEWKFQTLVAADVAKGIKAHTEALGREIGKPIKIRKTVADPSMFARTGHWGESLAETFGRSGVPLTRGDNDRVQGWQRLRHWFQNAPDGLPWLLYHPSCTYALKTIPSLVFDTNAMTGRPGEDLDTNGEDHAADTDRYGVMARPSPTRWATVTPSLDGTAGQLLRDLLTSQGDRERLGADAVRVS